MGEGVERNHKCSCGSGKKYKKCCINAQKKPNLSDEEVQNLVREMERKIELRKRALRGLGIRINFVKPIIFKGRKVWALGSRIYHQRPPNETFHEFLLFILIHEVLGEEWWTNQGSLPEDKQHHIYRSFKRYQEWALSNQTEENKTENGWGAFPDGWSLSILSLAFDIASLIHSDHLPEDLLERLRGYEEYQSARYEIAIAAIFARLGFKIEFLNEKKIKTKHCEFYAHDESGEVIAVEAKSRKREGVLHVDGTYNGEYWAHIRRSYRKAMEQNPGDRPFLIFFDINAPQAPGLPPLEKPWIKEVKELHSKLPLNTPQNPSLSSGEIFTNYSFHYQEEDQATAGEYLLTVPIHPVFLIQTPNFWDDLSAALSNYGCIPNLNTDFDSDKK